MLNNKKFFIVFFLSLLCLLTFVQSVKAETYTYTATNFQPISCPYGSQVTAMNLTSPGDIVKIVGTGFGDRDVADGIGESTYIPNPTTGGLYNVYRGSRVEGGGSVVYFGLSSWSDSEIDLEVTQGLGNSLGSYIILRTYSSADDNHGTCVRGDLAAGLICTSFTYSDWATCQSSGTQTRTVLNSYPAGCSNGNPTISQSCIPACADSDYSCGDWSNCSVSDNQTRTCTKISNCDGGAQMPAISQSCIYVPPVCSSWTYSSWSACQVNGTQTRTITSSSPDGCTGGDPVLTQNCNYIPACTVNDYSCSDWSACSQNSRQTRICNKTTNCQGGTSFPAITQTCTYTPACISFYYSSWSVCSSDGTQTRTITSKYPSNCVGGVSSQTSQSCTPPCDADTWTCGAWGSCSPSGIQSRTCTKTFDCLNVQTAPPITDQYCDPPNRPAPQVPPSGNDKVLNQDTIIKATVQLICFIDSNNAYEGSGTVIDPGGIILTNKHMVSGTVGCLVGFINNLNDKPYFDNSQIADIVKVSSAEDMAILKLRNPNNRQFTYINITSGNSNIDLGTKINVYGYPAIFGEDITYTNGVFSGTDGNYLKTTAILEHGNSGGGAYFNDGTFIGIPSRVVKGELNSLSEILSINTISPWLGNTSNLTYGNSANNNYSKVSSILESIDLKKLGSLQSVVPGKAPVALGQTQKKSIVIEPNSSDKKINSQQNNPTSSGNEQKPKVSWLKRFFLWLKNLL